MEHYNCNRELQLPPLPINQEETTLPRSTHATLTQLRSDWCYKLIQLQSQALWIHSGNLPLLWKLSTPSRPLFHWLVAPSRIQGNSQTTVSREDKVKVRRLHKLTKKRDQVSSVIDSYWEGYKAGKQELSYFIMKSKRESWKNYCKDLQNSREFQWALKLRTYKSPVTYAQVVKKVGRHGRIRAGIVQTLI